MGEQPIPGQDASLEELRAAEREVFAEIQMVSPEKLLRPLPKNPREVNERIGIHGLPDRPRGYIRHLPQDFVVEEIDLEGTLSTVEIGQSTPEGEPAQPTLFVDLVKLGIGTLESVQQIARAVGIPPTAIGYAGLKDGRALTSQRMSLRHADWGKVQSASFAQCLLKPRSFGKGAVAIGQLKGNRFSILVRTETSLDADSPQQTLQRSRAEGFLNFYGPQRFGNRLWNPHLGMLLCRGEGQEAIRVFLVEPGPFDTPLYREIREQAKAHYENWGVMKTVFGQFPYTFRHELAVIRALQASQGNWRRALAAIPDQVRFWVYGYASFLVNQALSLELTEGVQVPNPLPLPLGESRAHELYQPLLERDQTIGFAEQLRSYPYVVRKDRAILPRLRPEIHGIAVVPEGIVMSFSLPKGAYATTFLLSLFELYEGSPIPSWVRRDTVDVKHVLGTGSLTETVTRLGVSNGAEVSEEEGV